ncbi:amidohydrolase [Candidatus Bathyarchaeota archaeon]|nr:amidohydrolase [Candidatus Bathyarchaeota archaeon]
MVDKASLVIKNGRIYTVDKTNPWAQALAVNGDKIVYVGPNKGAEKYIDSDTRIIDAKNRLVLPGFIDTHIHAVFGYQQTSWMDLSSATSLEEVYELVKEHAEKHSDARLIGGYGWNYDAVMSDRGLPNKEDLDSVVNDRPAWLISYCGHTGWANSKFTKIAEQSLEEKESDLGEMERDPETGEPTGIFFRAFDLLPVGGSISSLIKEKQIEGLKQVINQAIRFGITSIHDPQADLEDLEAYKQLRNEDALNVRVYIALYHHKETAEENLIRFEEARSRFFDEWIKVGAVKLYIDGVPETHTAAVLEPYSDDPSTTGSTVYTPDEFKKITARLDKKKFQIFTHSCGDRGVRVIFDAYENAMRKNGRRDSRHRIEHVEVISQEDIPRFRQLGVIADMMPRHAAPDFDGVYSVVLGPKRLKTAFPWNSLDKAGAVLAFSSDWPVAEMNPLLGIHTALTRSGDLSAEEAISLEKAIEGYTINAAYASFEEDIKGSIEVGKLADIIILSDNLFEIPADKVKDVEVLLTIVGGKEVYRSDKI